jgi:hypothetical protein
MINQLYEYMNSEYYYNKMEFYITVSSKQKICLIFRYFKYHVNRTLVSGDKFASCKKKPVVRMSKPIVQK